MRTATFLYRCHSDAASLSGGNWIEDGDVSLANVQNDRYWSVARSASPLAADAQIQVDMRRAVSVRGFALALPNITTAAEVTVTAFADAGYTAPTFTTGPITGGESGERWKDDERAPIISAVFAQEVSARYWLVEIDDPLNAAGAVEVARLFLAEGISPSFNYDYGATLTFRNNTLSSSTLAGGNVYWRRVNPRQWQCAFNYLPDEEVFGSVYDFLRFVGFDREVFIIPEPGDVAHAQARSFFGTITQLDPLSQAVVGRSSFGFGVEERIAFTAARADFSVLPTDRMKISDFAPSIGVAVDIVVPYVVLSQSDYAVEVASGVHAILPSDDLEQHDYSVGAGGGVVLDVPESDLLFSDYAPFVAVGTGIAVPADTLNQTDYAVSVFTGANAFLPADGVIIADFAPLFGTGVFVEITEPSDQKIRNYTPAVASGVNVGPPVEQLAIADFAIGQLGGFNAGFDSGFR